MPLLDLFRARRMLRHKLCSGRGPRLRRCTLGINHRCVSSAFASRAFYSKSSYRGHCSVLAHRKADPVSWLQAGNQENAMATCFTQFVFPLETPATWHSDCAVIPVLTFT